MDVVDISTETWWKQFKQSGLRCRVGAFIGNRDCELYRSRNLSFYRLYVTDAFFEFGFSTRKRLLED